MFKIRPAITPRCEQRRTYVLLLGLLGAALVSASTAVAQTEATPTTAGDPATVVAEEQPDVDDAASQAAPPTTPEATEGDTTAADATPREARNPKSYGLWVLAPAIIAIILAIFTRQVVPALVVAVTVGAYMMVPCLPDDSPHANLNPIVGGFRLAAETYVVGVVADPAFGYGKIKIMIFTLVIGFMVGVIGRNGGTAGMVDLVAGRTQSPRRGGVTAWLAGLVVFFDDYANTMLVGPTMRSLFDRLKLSRAKLAYIVDSTAAPVASLALVGTWVGAEIGFIQTGIDKLTASGVPAFLVDAQGNVVTGMQAFIASLPYRFYPILALFLVFLVVLTRRDFGPMRRSEARAQSGQDEHPYDVRSAQPDVQAEPRWWLGVVPVLILVGATVAVLAITGYAKSGGREIMQQPIPWWEKASLIINGADSYIAIFYAALLSAIAAVILSVVTRACPTREACEAGLDGMARMFPAIVILILAWALSTVEQSLMLGEVVTAHLQAIQFPVQWAPLAIFVCAGGISFATGTSWGTMGILCPAAVTISAGLAADLEPDKALPLFYAAVGSVLAGAIFGDHCSPISDTTVLSSVASGCRHEEHVWTQLPYALVAAVTAMGLGDVMCSVYHQPWYFGLGAGAVFLLLVVLIVGRRPKLVSLPPAESPELLPSSAPTALTPRRAEDPSWQRPGAAD